MPAAALETGLAMKPSAARPPQQDVPGRSKVGQRGPVIELPQPLTVPLLPQKFASSSLMMKRMTLISAANFVGSSRIFTYYINLKSKK